MKNFVFSLIFLASLKVSVASVPLKASELKVLTLNTWMIPVQRKMARARAEAIGRELHQYDLAFLQEVFTTGVRNTITNNIVDDDLKRRYFRNLGYLNSGLVTFSRFEITKSSFMRFADCGGIQCVSAKGVLYLQIKLPSGDLVDLFNTHLQAYEKDAHIRARQLKKAMDFINRHNDGTNPAIFAGDFNVIAEIQEYHGMMGLLGQFKDVWAEINPKDPGYTWDPSINYWAEYDYDESELLQRIDYIFIRDGQHSKWSIMSAELAYNTEKEWYGVYKNANQIFVSDHFGVEATLKLIPKSE
jgi:endonuclease/exonuclease/phosphatase family metal-dependent hydrolase